MSEIGDKLDSVGKRDRIYPEALAEGSQLGFGNFFSKFSNAIIEVTNHRGDTMVTIKPSVLRDCVKFLKYEEELYTLIDLFGMDYLKLTMPQGSRFAVIYNLYGLTAKKRIFLKAYLDDEKPEIDSLYDIFAAANWFEREAWDLFGIVFKGHPHLVRILCHNKFSGHPLRKDYPSDKYQRLDATTKAVEL